MDIFTMIAAAIGFIASLSVTDAMKAWLFKVFAIPKQQGSTWTGTGFDTKNALAVAVILVYGKCTTTLVTLSLFISDPNTDASGLIFLVILPSAANFVTVLLLLIFAGMNKKAFAFFSNSLGNFDPLPSFHV